MILSVLIASIELRLLIGPGYILFTIFILPEWI